MGIILDSHKMEARLSVDKVEWIKTALWEFRSKQSMTLQEFQSLLLGVIPLGCPFLQRKIALIRGVKNPITTLSSQQVFSKTSICGACLLSSGMVSGCSYLPFGTPLRPSPYSQMPLAPSVNGGFFQTSWFQGSWLPHQQLGSPGMSILWQELFAIVVAWDLWGHKWTSRRIKFHCDNLGVVEVINYGKSKVPRVMDLVRDLTLCTLRHNFYFQAVHVPGKHNNIADSLSRFQMEHFRQLAPQFCASPDPIPASLLCL